MKARIVKNNKHFLIEVIDNEKIINQMIFNSLDEFTDDWLLKYDLKSFEISNNLILTYKSIYPKMNKTKLDKIHLNSFKECYGKEYSEISILKRICKDVEGRKILCYYFMNHELAEFVNKHNIKNKNIKLIDEKTIFNNKYNDLLLINNYEISLWHNSILFYHQNIKNKVSSNIISALLFTSKNVKKVNLVMYKENYDSFSTFIRDLKTRLEDKVVVNIEKI